MKWATRSGVHVDRAACAWLIRRFRDPDAEFVFVDDPDEVPDDAVPFDMRGVELSHHGGDATWCQGMTSWMNEQMSNGSMMGSSMWGDPEQMLTTCRSWMNAKPSGDRPSDWCDGMVRGMWPHMNGDWEDWNDWMNGPMMDGS